MDQTLHSNGKVYQNEFKKQKSQLYAFYKEISFILNRNTQKGCKDRKGT